MSVQRVVLVSPYALSVNGGVQEQVLAMSRELRARALEVLVVAPGARDHGPFDTSARVLTRGSVVAIPANGSRAPLTLSPRAARQVARAVRDFSPDVVHFHEPFAPLLGWSLLHRHDTASVGTFHRSGGGPSYRLTKPLLRHLAGKLDELTCVSESARETLETSVGLTASVLFNGFETQRFREFARVEPNVPTLLFLGRLEKRKGCAVLMDVVRHQHRGNETPWRLIVAGSGPLENELRALARGDERIELVGSVTDEQKRQLLRSVSVVVAPSLGGESFGLVLLEALASGTPLVASAIDGYQRAAGSHAVFATPGDARSLEAAIREALSRTDQSERDAAQRYAEQWSMTHLVDGYLAIYERARERFGSRGSL